MAADATRTATTSSRVALTVRGELHGGCWLGTVSLTLVRALCCFAAADVLCTSGHRIGTAEIESALVAHSLVAEAAVVGIPHNIKGEGICCYITLVKAAAPGKEAEKELVLQVREHIGAFATPDVIVWAPGLPKVRLLLCCAIRFLLR